MNTKFAIRLTAAMVTLLVISCLGVLVTTLDYLMVLGLERVVEFVGLLPKHFLQNHELVLPIATTITVLPILIYFTILMYNTAYEVESDLNQPTVLGNRPPS